MEMTKREQVIAELRYLKHDCLEGSATDQTIDKAIALLEEQEPRVLSYDKLEDTMNDRAVWYEGFLTGIPTLAIVVEKSAMVDAYIIFDHLNGMRHQCTRKTYGDAWRCWTSRPTDAQREATPWETQS